MAGGGQGSRSWLGTMWDLPVSPLCSPEREREKGALRSRGACPKPTATEEAMEADGSAVCPVCGTSFMVHHCPGALGGPGMADPWGAGTEVSGKESPGICKGD